VRADQTHRRIEREEDRLQHALDTGQISGDEFRAEMLELQQDAREAYQMDQEEALERIRDEWGG